MSKLAKAIKSLEDQIHALKHEDDLRRKAFLITYLRGMSPKARLVKYAGMGHVELFWWDFDTKQSKRQVFGPSDPPGPEYEPPLICLDMRTSYESTYERILNLALDVSALPVVIEERRTSYDVSTKFSSGKLKFVTLKYHTQQQLQEFVCIGGKVIDEHGLSRDGTWFAHVNVSMI